MSLAHVVYNMSTDSDFAAQWRNNPEAALALRGLRLSREELEFLMKGLTRSVDQHRLRLVDLPQVSWKE